MFIKSVGYVQSNYFTLCVDASSYFKISLTIQTAIFLLLFLNK